MKRLSFLLISLFFLIQAMNAQVARDKVIFEIGTGVNCPYCPAAANGVHQMIEEGLQIAVVKYHTSAFSIPQFYTTETIARVSWYGISSYPTTKVDGILTQVGGGGAGQTNYGAYMPLYNQRIGIQSAFTIDLDWENTGGTNYVAHVTINKVGTTTATNIKFVLALTESEINYSWQGMSQLNYVCRDLIPDQNGTTLDFSSTSTITLDLPFTWNSTWVRNNCELTGIVQNWSTKEALQGTKKTMRTPDFALDAELFEVKNIPDEMCAGLLEPEVTIKNLGADILTSLDVNFKVNGTLVYTYPWTGLLEFYDGATFEIPEFTFAAMDENDIEVYISSPNGGVDENPSNDSQTFETVVPENVEDMMILIMKTDDNPQETSWKVFDATGNVVDEGGPYTVPQLFFRDTVYYQTPGCHQFVIYDAAGNGLSTYYTVRSFINGTLTSIGSGGAFGYKEATHFTVEMEGVSAAFTADVNEGCEELTVHFMDNSFGNITSWNWSFPGGNPASSTDQNPTVFYAQPGVYDVTLTVSDGTNNSTYTDEDCISVYELPVVTFGAIDQMCVSWPAYELTEGLPAGGTYSGNGVVDGWFHPEVAGIGTHTITYAYTDADGCENSAQQDVVVDACTGIGELTKFGLQIYPNPSGNTANINFFLEEAHAVTITLYNNIGMEVKQLAKGNFNAGLNTIVVNSSEYQNGVYFVRFEAGENSSTQKITILK